MAEKKVDFFMPLWVGDYLADTSHLDAEQHGAYLLLLMAAWKRGGRLPTDPVQLARIACCPQRRWLRVWGIIAHFFELDGDQLTQRRVSRELEAAQKTQAGRRAGGRASAESRRQKTGSADPKVVRSNPGERTQNASAQAGLSDNGFSPNSAESRQPPRTGLSTRSEHPQPQPDPQQQPGESRAPGSSQPASPLRSGSGPIVGWRAAAMDRPQAYRLAHVGAATAAFLDVYDAYPNKAGKISASQVWQDLAADFQGGEQALRDAIVGQFTCGMLGQHPYAGEARYVPSLERFLRERRWEDKWQDGRRPPQQASDLPESA